MAVFLPTFIRWTCNDNIVGREICEGVKRPFFSSVWINYEMMITSLKNSDSSNGHQVQLYLKMNQTLPFRTTIYLQYLCNIFPIRSLNLCHFFLKKCLSFLFSGKKISHCYFYVIAKSFGPKIDHNCAFSRDANISIPKKYCKKIYFL